MVDFCFLHFYWKCSFFNQAAATLLAGFQTELLQKQPAPHFWGLQRICRPVRTQWTPCKSFGCLCSHCMPISLWAALFLQPLKYTPISGMSQDHMTETWNDADDHVGHQPGPRMALAKSTFRKLFSDEEERITYMLKNLSGFQMKKKLRRFPPWSGRKSVWSSPALRTQLWWTQPHPSSHE